MCGNIGMKHLIIFLLISIVLAGCGTSLPSAEKSSDVSDEAYEVREDANTGETSASESTNNESSEQSGNTGTEVPSASRDIFAMDTYMTITCYGDRCEEALDAAVDEINRLDDLLSVGNEESEISLLNNSGSAVLSTDSSVMVETALDVYDTTNGCFDITVYPLMNLWGFPTLEFHLPSEQELEDVLKTVGSDKLLYDKSEHLLTLQTGMGIDLGGIAKGYSSDRLMEIFEEYDLVSALISLGGNVQCYHAKPDGSLWRCGIRNPFDPDNMSNLIGIVSVQDAAVITSGAYERYFTGEDGQIYHHILDPHTGYPANNGLSSVTIVSSSGILADSLSTACYVMGLEESVEYWKSYGSDFDMILVTDEGDVYITEPIQNRFTTNAALKIISKE